MTIFQIKVFSELYEETECCIQDMEHALSGGFSPCADGTDYKLTHHEIEQLKEAVDYATFTPSSKLEYPLNLVALMLPEGNFIKIPQYFRFNKKQYTDVKTVMQKAAGTYTKNAFSFKEAGIDVYLRIINGEKYNLKKEFQFFATNPARAAHLVELAEIDSPDLLVLEPSAGDGAIVKAILSHEPGLCVHVFELMPQNRDLLSKIEDCILVGEDFLNNSFDHNLQFDRIIANPPFSNNQDIDHIREMYRRLKRGGILVSIASKHWQFASGKKEVAFKDWLGSLDADIEEIPAGDFKESGTNVSTCIIKIRKPV